MGTAGRAVVFSGTTVAVGLLALVVAAAAVPAQHGLRRHADPARGDARGDHAAAGDPRDVGPRLDRRRIRPPRPQPRVLAALGRGRRAPPLASRPSSALADPRRARSSPPRTCTWATPTRTPSPRPAPPSSGLDALARLGHRQGRDRARTRRSCPSGAAADVVGRAGRVDGVHGAAAPAAPDWRRDGHGRSSRPCPTPGRRAQAGRDAVQDVRDAGARGRARRPRRRQPAR